MTFGLRCSGPACRPHPASLPVRVPTVESLPPASFGFPLAVAPCGLATVAVIGPDWLLSSNKTLPMLGTPRGRPPGRPASRRTMASAAVQGDRPTKPMAERLPEPSRYPTFENIREREHRGFHEVRWPGGAKPGPKREECPQEWGHGSLKGYSTAAAAKGTAAGPSNSSSRGSRG